LKYRGAKGSGDNDKIAKEDIGGDANAINFFCSFNNPNILAIQPLYSVFRKEKNIFKG